RVVLTPNEPDTLLCARASPFSFALPQQDRRQDVQGVRGAALISDLTRDCHALLEAVACGGLISLRPGQESSAEECLRPHRRPLRGALQRPFEPSSPLTPATTVEPEPEQGACKPQGDVLLFGIVAPGECCPEVALFRTVPSEPGGALPTIEERLGLLRERAEEPRVAPTHLICLTRLDEALHPVVPDRLEHAIARLARDLGHDHERFVHQSGEEVQDLCPLQTLSGAHR